VSKQKKLLDQHWETLVERIRDEQFMPFIGAEECSEGVSPASEIAREWAAEYRYPLMEGEEDLARVAQFMVVNRRDEHYPHRRLANKLKTIRLESTPADDPHRLFAKLPLPIYVTTNHHTLMAQALRAAKREVKEDWCRWNDPMARSKAGVPIVLSAPTIANPCVFHLFGSVEHPDGLVLTEDNYLDFLIRISEESKLIPSWIEEAVTTNSLLFIGYHPRDFEFRVLLRCLRRQLNLHRHFSLSVSIDVVTRATPKPEMAEVLREYLEAYCQDLRIQVHWQSPRAFLRELHDRCVRTGILPG